jgi:succinoglycan biosynthesis transport protein ExoP
MNETTVVLPARRDGARAVTASAAPINAYPAYPTEEREGGAFGNVAAMLRRRVRLVLIVFLGIVAAGVGLTLLQTPKYSATALLMINPNPDQVVSEKQSLTSSRADAGSVDSEIEVLKSPALAARLASELKLDADPEWTSGPEQPVRPPTDTQTPTSGAYSGFSGVEAAATQSLAPSAPAAAAGLLTGSSATPPAPKVADDVVAAVAEAIDVRRRGLSYVVEVSVTSQSPERAAEMANGLSNIYLKSLAEARYDTSEKANAWLKDRLDELKIEVQQKQAAAQAYRASRNLMTIQGTGLAEQQIAVIQTSLLQTRAEYAQKRSEYEQLNSISNKGQTVSSFNGGSDTMRELR